MIDYHIHTHHSIDAEGTINEYCQRALQIGLKEICITNHCELDPARHDSWIRFSDSEQPVTNRGLKRLQREVEQTKELYKKSGLTVRFGLEVGYYQGIESRLQETMNGVKFDFVLGSIHCLNHICIDSSREHVAYFSRHKASELLAKYYEAVESLITSRLFDSLGHIDVYKKYGLKFYGDAIRNFSEDTISAIFRLMSEHNIALEINTAGWRCVDEPYPSPVLMKCAREQGLTLITIGSDCHKVAHLGTGISEALDYIKSFGFASVYGFHKRQPIKIKI